MNKLLVTTDWLAQHLHDPKLRIIDIRGRVLPPSEPLPHYYAHRAEYEQSHIEGAVFVDWTKDIVDPQSPSQDIADAPHYAEFMGRLGVGDDTLVVAYDDADGMLAARMWWTLNYYGHEQVVILDGGWKKWTAENRPTTGVVPTITPGTFTPRINHSLRQTAQSILERAENVPLIDVRTPAEFNGQASRAKRKGHIPSAINLPRGVLVNSDGTMLAPNLIKLKLAESGVALDAPNIVLYCNGGVSASYGLLALRMAGYEQGSVYDGSWKDWGNREDLPIVPPQT
jgi:thiosulfate/3-mercaptopyruvate sulfurtransferase